MSLSCKASTRASVRATGVGHGWLWLLLILYWPGLGMALVVDDPQRNQWPLGAGFELLLDREDALSADQVRARTEWQPLTNLSQFTSHPYWLRMPLANTSGQTLDLLLVYPGPRVQRLEVWLWDGQQLQDLGKAGYGFHFTARPIASAQPLFPIALPPDFNGELLMRLERASPRELRQLSLWQPVPYYEQAQNSIAWRWLILGMILVMALINLVIYVTNRGANPSYGLFTLRAITVCGSFLAYYGLGFQYLWPEWPGWEMRSGPFFSMAGTAMLLLFFDSFLRLPRYHPVFSRLLRGIAALTLCLLVPILIGVPHPSYFSVLALLIVLPSTVILVGLSWTMAVAKRPNALSAALGVSCYLIGVVSAAISAAVESRANLMQMEISELIFLLIISFSLGSAISRRREEQQRQAAEIDAQNRLLAQVSHELRTPLNGILGTAELLGRSRLDGEQRELVNIICSSGELLESTINDIIDIARIKADELRLDHQGFRLDEVLCRSLKLFSARAQAKGVRLQMYVQPGLPLCLIGDGNRVLQVVNNLLGNAVKFTDSGNINVRALLDEIRIDGSCSLRIEVEDTGIGISAEQQRAVFEPFKQVASDRTRHLGGSGLGLAIGLSLAKRMGGNLSLRSTPGKGSCFTLSLTLPIDKPAETHVLSRRLCQAPHFLQGLFIGSDTERHQYFANYFELRGVRLTQYPDLDTVLTQNLAANIDLIIVDFHDALPMHRFQALLDLGRPTLVVGSNTGVVWDRFLGADNLCVLEGPVTMASWLDALDRVLRLAPAPTEAQPAQAQANILLVEDNPTNQLVARKLLENAGCQVRCANHGVEAMEQFAPGRFDLVVMDCEMPEMDGFEATRRIRASERQGQHQVIIGLTAHAFEEQTQACLDAGMDAVYSKPVTLVKVRQMLALLNR